MNILSAGAGAPLVNGAIRQSAAEIEELVSSIYSLSGEVDALANRLTGHIPKSVGEKASPDKMGSDVEMLRNATASAFRALNSLRDEIARLNSL